MKMSPVFSAAFRLVFLIFLQLAAFSLCVRAQDPHLTQFFANPLYMAPSYTGASQGHRAVIAYRDQWSMMPNMYRTMSVSYDVNIASLRSGVGVFVLGDMAGDGRFGTIIGGLTYSYSVAMTYTWSFRPGIGFFYRQNGLDYSRLVWGDQLNTDPASPTTVQQTGKNMIYDIDVSASVLFHSADAWVGATWDHMLMPKLSLFGEKARLPFKFSIFGGYRFVIQSLYRRGVDQSVSVMLNARLQQRYSQMEVGAYWFKYPLLLGVWYRGIPLVKNYMGSDAVAMMVGCRFSMIQVAYTYDLTVSRLGPSSGGSHEISITYEGKIVPKKRRFRAPTCPPY